MTSILSGTSGQTVPPLRRVNHRSLDRWRRLWVCMRRKQLNTILKATLGAYSRNSVTPTARLLLSGSVISRRTMCLTRHGWARAPPCGSAGQLTIPATNTSCLRWERKGREPLNRGPPPPLPPNQLHLRQKAQRRALARPPLGQANPKLAQQFYQIRTLLRRKCA